MRLLRASDLPGLRHRLRVVRLRLHRLRVGLGDGLRGLVVLRLRGLARDVGIGNVGVGGDLEVRLVVVVPGRWMCVCVCVCIRGEENVCECEGESVCDMCEDEKCV